MLSQYQTYKEKTLSEAEKASLRKKIEQSEGRELYVQYGLGKAYDEACKIAYEAISPKVGKPK
jgi:hypothetical protein